MIPRPRLASAFVFALLAMASVSHAQTADSVATKGPLAGRGGIGGQIGTSYIVAGPDYADGAQPRFTFIGHFRYQVNSTWGWQVSPYFTWNGYVSHENAPFVDPNFPTEGLSKQEYLTYVRGGSAQVQWFQGTGRSRWHLGLGPAVYQVVVENHRKVVEDPVSRRLHRGVYPGVAVQIGVERFLKSLPSTSLEFAIDGHQVFAKRDEQFPSGFNSGLQDIAIRLGGNYYFVPNAPKKPETGPPGPKP